MGPCWARPVDSSLALLSQQEDISWSNREAVDEGCLVSKENGVGEDWASPAGHCVPRAGPSPLASVLLKRKVRLSLLDDPDHFFLETYLSLL